MRRRAPLIHRHTRLRLRLRLRATAAAALCLLLLPGRRRRRWCDRVTAPVVQQVGDTRRLRVQHLVFAHGPHHTVVVPDPRRVRRVVHVRNVVALGRFLAVVVDDRKQLVLLLLLGLVLFRGEDFCVGGKRGGTGVQLIKCQYEELLMVKW